MNRSIDAHRGLAGLWSVPNDPRNDFTITDFSAFKRHASITNTTTPAANRLPGSGVKSLYSSGGAVWFTAPVPASPFGDFSFCIWSYRLANSNTFEWSNGVGSSSPFIFLNGSGQWYVDGGYRYTMTIPNGNWNCLAVTRTGTGAGMLYSFMLNGQVHGTYTGSNANQSTATGIFFNSGFGGYLNGFFAEAAVWSVCHPPGFFSQLKQPGQLRAMQRLAIGRAGAAPAATRNDNLLLLGVS